MFTNKHFYANLYVKDGDTMTKKELRSEIKERLCTLSNSYKKESGTAIQKLVLSLSEYKCAESIFIYISTDNEPDTSLIIEDALTSGKKVYVPKCIEKGIMVPVEIKTDTVFSSGYMGIREPVSYNEKEAVNNIDISVIPCVSASLSGERLGHGAGFYDIFLEKIKTAKICLCFHELITDNIPTDKNDIKTDAVITEKGIYY